MKYNYIIVSKICKEQRKGRAYLHITPYQRASNNKLFYQRVQSEVEARREGERTIRSLRKDVDDATLARIDLERKLETLQEELELLKATTNEVRNSIFSVMFSAESVKPIDACSKTELSKAIFFLTGYQDFGIASHSKAR